MTDDIYYRLPEPTADLVPTPLVLQDQHDRFKF